jgi:MarR family transcriptional regulator, organic hydroperoxide resistance regulator
MNGRKHPLHDYIGFRLLQAHRAHRSRAEAALNERGLHTGQEMLLYQLWRQEGLTQSELVEMLGVEPPTVTRTLQRLEQAGIVERRTDPEDARVTRVYLTDQGRALEKEVRAIWDKLESMTLRGLSDVEIALLGRLLDQISANLGR